MCSACGVARYCSKKCQIKDWDHHQTCCAMLNRELIYGEDYVQQHKSRSAEEREWMHDQCKRDHDEFIEKYGSKR